MFKNIRDIKYVAGRPLGEVRFENLSLPTGEVPVEIKRTGRKKSIQLEVRRDKVRLLVPKNTPDDEIRDLLARKSRWIARKVEELARRPKAETIEMRNGARLPLLGEEIRLKVETGSGIGLENAVLTVGISDPMREDLIRRRVVNWYQWEAESWLGRETQTIAKRLGIVCGRIQVKAFRARWGSCSVNGEISYNWRLILAPPDVVRYVIVHELCHIREHNHSPGFWRHVAEAMPDFKIHQQWLKDHGASLSF